MNIGVFLSLVFQNLLNNIGLVSSVAWMVEHFFITESYVTTYITNKTRLKTLEFYGAQELLRNKSSQGPHMEL